MLQPAMLQNIKELYGDTIAALDGDIGHVKDFYFDDKSWVVRYLVVDTGTWLTGRLVLLAPHVFARWDLYQNRLHVKVQKRQVENSPPIEAHTPVSRQFEEEYYRYYGWPPYWQGDQIWGLGSYPSILPLPIVAERPARPSPRHRADQHLRSARAVTGYHLQAADGTIGRVTDLMIDDKSWAIRELVVETGHWYAGRVILMSPQYVERIDHEESKMISSHTQADIQRTSPRQDARPDG